MKDYGNSNQFEELLWPVAAQPSSLPGGYNYRDVHSVYDSVSLMRVMAGAVFTSRKGRRAPPPLAAPPAFSPNRPKSILPPGGLPPPVTTVSPVFPIQRLPV